MSPCSSQMQNVEPSRMVSATEPCTLLCAPELATLASSGDRYDRVPGFASLARTCSPALTKALTGASELATLASSGDRYHRVPGFASLARTCSPAPTERSLPPVAGAELDRHRAAVLDLESRVVDAEALVEQLLELAADRMAIVAGVDEHVRRERREARPDRKST